MHSEMKKILEESQEAKRGVTLHISGSTIGGAVVRIINNEIIELKNQSSSKIIVLVKSVDAVVMS
jgi:hypothetical protein